MSEHAIREYLKTIGNGGGAQQETDPVFVASPAHGISAQDIADWNDKQDELVSGTNIKTINGQSLLGSGDLPVAPPVTSTDVPTADTISEFDSDAHMNSTDMTTGADSELEDFIDGLNISGGGVEHIAVATNVDAYKIGNVVSVHFNGVSTTSTTARTVYGTLPVGWRPPIIAINGNISGNTGYGDVETNGQVQAFRPTIGRVDVTVTYIATQ